MAEYMVGAGLGLMVIGIGLALMPMFWIGAGLIVFGSFVS
jgi:hypothetical protein